ncbi:Protein tanc2 [Pleodorina starrii]|uniref:Protein tanc2 n=1 Tax=Pleodorina starrii TaxID=330485 RepID=A0A9W6C0W6_9CHLO|nr:Protein tanc2 [Pleodorina starrii]GLC61853.1 Protein tanc2 [Pleodorina starrii]GLC76913.1 Protein tanc2 [Pleodorina starrii]
MDMSGRPRGRAVADHSAEFVVEDVIPVPRLPRDTKDANARLPRLHKPPKSNASQSSGNGALPKQPIAGLDPHRLGQRQKQVDYGKNTIGYQRYLQQVPKDKRRRKGEQWLDPVTPDINQNISKRCFDGQIKVWRRALHKYDDHGEEDDQQVQALSFAERTRQRILYKYDASAEDVTAVSAVPSSPTNSSRSRGSLDGYIEPQFADGGRKRCFQRAFDHAANGNPHPSKLITSPAGPKPFVPQSAPPATAADAEPAPSPASRLGRLPPSRAGSRAGAGILPRGAGASLSAGAHQAPQTAPPAAAARVRVTAGSTADDPDLAARSELGAAAGEDLFREWEDDDYAGLEPLADEELDQVCL